MREVALLCSCRESSDQILGLEKNTSFPGNVHPNSHLVKADLQLWQKVLFFLRRRAKFKAAGRVRLIFWKQKTGPGSSLQGLGKWLGPSFVHHNGRTANFSKGWIFTHDLLAQWNLWTRKIENLKTWNVWKSTPSFNQKSLRNFCATQKFFDEPNNLIVGICPLGTNISPQKALLRMKLWMIFLLPWSDMLVPWRADEGTINNPLSPVYGGTPPQLGPQIPSSTKHTGWSLEADTTPVLLIGRIGTWVNNPE